MSLSGKPDAMLVLNHENRSIRQRRGLRYISAGIRTRDITPEALPEGAPAAIASATRHFRN
ncbi:hypothetical protein L810_6577 [Burkholderia sp. AU4i]|nr:hypothetical protein L810_6577 [Burkholderia sp. AU4i]